NGVLFVLFTSPYCGHCRVFAPTWENLVEHSLISADRRYTPAIESIYMRLIMPAVLCNAQGIKGYPQMNLYCNGEFVDTYYGSRRFDLLVTYLAAAAAN
ncbi:hypothetical protein B0H14DRAFT_2176653, partial [Mycena olivaceomarginata]